MYADMARTAEEEGFLALAAQFEGVGKIEKLHEERYLKLAERVEVGCSIESHALVKGQPIAVLAKGEQGFELVVAVRAASADVEG